MDLDAGYMSKMEVAKAFKDNQKPISCLDFDDNGNFCVTASEDDSIHVYDTLHGRFKQLLYSKKYGVQHIRFTHRQTNVIHTSTLQDDNVIRYLSLHDNRYLMYFKGHKKRVTSLAMSPKSDMFLSGSTDDCVRLWDLRDPVSLGAMDVSESPVLSFDPRGLIFALGLGSRVIRPYDVRQYQKGPFYIWDVLESINNFEKSYHGSGPMAPNHRAEWTNLHFSPDGNHILITTRSGVHYLIDSYTGNLVTHYHGHVNTRGMHLQANFTPDSKYVYSGSEDGVVYVWDKMTGKELEYLQGHTAPVTNVLFNPKYMMFATAADTQLAFWLPRL